MTDETGFSISELLATPFVHSASFLMDFFKANPNRFFTKKMLLDKHGFSSNIGRNLANLTTTDPKATSKLWRMSAKDISNPKNKKQQSFYIYVDQKPLSQKQVNELIDRCSMGTSKTIESKKSSKITKSSKTQK